MAKMTAGKVLLRNVIRHTDAHNKIQEESEMWKLRDWEKQMSHHKHLSDTECMRGRMHCDRVPDYPRDQTRSKERASGRDDREARYWTRKLYEFEANDPDRWGHSGFKELYPEEFEGDSEDASCTKKNGHHKKKKSKSSTETAKPKRSKKSSRKKKKKKKNEDEKRKRAACTSGDSSSDERNAIRCKQGRKRPKSKHKDKKSERHREREKDSGSEESDDEGERERRTRSRKKRKHDSHKGSDSGVDSQKRRRKNWKAANEENTDDSSGD